MTSTLGTTPAAKVGHRHVPLRDTVVLRVHPRDGRYPEDFEIGAREARRLAWAMLADLCPKTGDQTGKYVAPPETPKFCSLCGVAYADLEAPRAAWVRVHPVAESDDAAVLLESLKKAMGSRVSATSIGPARTERVK